MSADASNVEQVCKNFRYRGSEGSQIITGRISFNLMRLSDGTSNRRRLRGQDGMHSSRKFEKKDIRKI